MFVKLFKDLFFEDLPRDDRQVPEIQPRSTHQWRKACPTYLTSVEDKVDFVRTAAGNNVSSYVGPNSHGISLDCIVTAFTAVP